MCNDDTVNELKKDFHYTLSKFSHEIRNPLTLINSGLQMIASAHPEVEDYEHWDDVMDNLSYVRELLDELSVDRDFYNYRERNEDEIFPWDFIDIGVSKQFLRREYANAKQGKVTPNCKQKCSGCGAASFHAGICMMDRKASGGSAQGKQECVL